MYGFPNIANANIFIKRKSLKRKSTTLMEYFPAKRCKMDIKSDDGYENCFTNSSRRKTSNIPENFDNLFTKFMNSKFCLPEENISTPNNNVEKFKHTYKVTEIYQIGFQIGDTERIYIPNMLDFQDVTYPYYSDIELTDQTIDNIWNIMTPMILSENYQLDLIGIQTEGMAQLERYLERNLSAMIDRVYLNKIREMLSDHMHTVKLRKEMIRLIRIIWPSMQFKSQFDESSVQLDYLLDRLVTVQSNFKSSPIQLYVPIVSLYRSFGDHLKDLRQKSLSLIKMLLPCLKLPPEFEIGTDLSHLINRICSVN